MIFVVDSSVATKWFVEEPRHELAKRMILAGDRLVAPDWAYAEVTNVLWRKARSGELSIEQVRAAISAIPARLELLGSDEGLMTTAIELAQLLEHSIYDCVFLATALRIENAMLVTDDGRFAEKAASKGFGDKLRWLSDQPLKLAFSDAEIDRLRRLHEISANTISSLIKKVGQPLGDGGSTIYQIGDLQPAFEAPTYVALKREICRLSPHQSAVLIALAWLGRGYDGDDFDGLYDQAAHLAAEPDRHAPYIISLITHIDRGIAAYREKLTATELEE
ncbi:MAG: PIN domain-containing protein [Rhizobiaceae bacterium]|nr:PIN domain-containing protein [Rhizobiaceae bacterium]